MATADVSVMNAVNLAVEKLTSQLGAIDILVNNAGALCQNVVGTVTWNGLVMGKIIFAKKEFVQFEK